MNKPSLIALHKNLCEIALKIALQRGKEYATDEDELRTFKTAAATYGCKPQDIARMQLCLKVARMQEGIKQDTLLDIINYAVYLEALREVV